MSNPKKLVIFDIDGTLTDSVTLYQKVVGDIKLVEASGVGKLLRTFSGSISIIEHRRLNRLRKRIL